MVAGVIGARDNELGGVGVAPRATLFNFDYLVGVFHTNLLRSWSFNIHLTAVSNHSYGPSYSPQLRRESRAWHDTVEHGLEHGFDGKGAVHVLAAGNGRGSSIPDSGLSSLQEFHNHRGVVNVCAVDGRGKVTSYSSFGPNLWVCAPSRGSNDEGIVATYGS